MRERIEAALHALTEPDGLRAYGAENSTHVSRPSKRLLFSGGMRSKESSVRVSPRSSRLSERSLRSDREFLRPYTHSYTGSRCDHSIHWVRARPTRASRTTLY